MKDTIKTLEQKVKEQDKLILELIDENNKFRRTIKLQLDLLKSKNEYIDRMDMYARKGRERKIDNE